MLVNGNTSRFVEAINVIHSKIIYLQLDSSSEPRTTYIWKTWLRRGRNRSQSEDSTSNTEEASYPGMFQDSGEIAVPKIPRLANGTMSCRKASLTSHFRGLSRRTPRSRPGRNLELMLDYTLFIPRCFLWLACYQSPSLSAALSCGIEEA
jgi:hypothetical protein